MIESRHDIVIVGAGSAGCVLANRLSADGTLRVLLLEAGGADRNPFIHMPAGIARLVDDPDIDWRYHTEPEPHLDGRRLYWPRGRVLGGSSSINAMCYTRGQPADYDDWAARGNPGWDSASVLPYFLRMEDHWRGASAWHGAGGPLAVSRGSACNPLSRVFVAAAQSLGIPLNDDFNGARQEGVGFYDVTQRDGRRCSTAVGYLRPARVRPGLEVRTRARTLRVLLEAGRAVGVEYLEGGSLRTARADREVIICGGTIGSPQLLMYSGIGPAAALGAAGLPVAHDRPGVGANLQDHLDVCTLYRSLQPVTYDFNALQQAWVGLRYLLTRSGPGASNVAEAGAFLRSSVAEDSRPDIQLHFVPAQLDDHGRHRLPGHGFTVHACALRPSSRGRILPAGSDPLAAPRIEARYLVEPSDLDCLLEGIAVSREIVAQSPFDAFRGREIFPGADARDRDALHAFVRRKAESIYHPVGTCRMGPADDPGAVVDARLRVHGVEGLRVVDASVMPRIVSSNTNAATIMIAERASDWILAGP